MKGLSEIGLKLSYAGKGEKIRDEFLLPALGVSVGYDRITSFFTTESLLAISQGIQSLYKHKGRMRLIIGIHSIPGEIADASLCREQLRDRVNQIRHDVAQGLTTIADSLEKQRLATLAWMIQDGLLEVRAAIVEGGLFHPKTLIFEDLSGNKVAAIGSSNETSNGLGSNFEQVLVVNSWDMSDAVAEQEQFFDSLWNDTNADATVVEISDEVASMIIESLGNEYRRPTIEPKTDDHAEKNAIATAAKMPANYFVSGLIPALFQHQERAVIDALSRWPVRVLLSDEVGLGKTFEAAAVATYLMRHCGVRRVLILTPKAVLQQWQEELDEKFGIEAWLYDSLSREYRDPRGRVTSIGSSNPIGSKAPSVMLMSAQFARGTARRKSIFESAGALYPDLLVLDEAHSARLSKDLSGKSKPTRMYSMLEVALPRIPHVVFATATPMQKDASEYQALLKLLGLPKPWRNPRSYMTSLNLIASPGVPGADDAYKAGKLLLSTMNTMKPSLESLTDQEREALSGLLELGVDSDSFDIAAYVEASWRSLQGAFIKLHPAQLLTVRNTRRSLEKAGYVFPRRQLNEVPVDIADRILLFYSKVEEYISCNFFSVEKALYPDKRFSTGFVKISYQQRVASSLHSCRESLLRRLEKIKSLRAAMEASGAGGQRDVFSYFGIDEFDLMDEDDVVQFDEDLFDRLVAEDDSIDLAALESAIDLEMTSVSPLAKEAKDLLSEYGDAKVDRSIEIAKAALDAGDQVLLFSRYKDTVDALIDGFSKSCGNCYAYGIYDGGRSIAVFDGVQTDITKGDIKKQLASGNLKAMICSDAASEGLNLQAARVLINVDVPWTPSRLEQRIGRIARLGQTAKEVEIYNIWYPNSVEARMYRRIHKRLEETNLAVGEFPEVVADGIRNLVLEDREQEDDSLAALQELRNSVQMRALGKLWSTSEPGITSSCHIREGLMRLCESRFKCVDTRQHGEIKGFDLGDGRVVWLTARDGCPESISLGSEPWSSASCDDLAGFHIVNDSEGNPAAFAKDDCDSRWLVHECLPDMLIGELEGQDGLSGDRPRMLPNNTSLSLEFALEGEAPRRPDFWPPAD